MVANFNFPRQVLPASKKTEKWGKECVDWGAKRTFSSYTPVRNSVLHKKINYDLLRNVVHIKDIEQILNPENIDGHYIPDRIQHYPIINPKLGVLLGEESRRVFDYRVVITNPNSISEVEETKKQSVLAAMQQTIQASMDSSEDEYNQKMEALSDYYTYNYQDFREARANQLLSHYSKEYNFPLIYNNGFMDGLTVAEEIYMCDIVSGEPVIERVNPLDIRAYRFGTSNKFEDADVIILEQYWSPSRIIDVYYDSLSEKDVKYIEELPFNNNEGDYLNDPRNEFLGTVFENIETGDGFYSTVGSEMGNSFMPYDMAGNVRVVRVFWKSKRKIKKVKSYDPETGEEIYNFYPETYICDEAMGEEEQIFWINEAWEGTKIGDEVYVNIRPRVVQYNRMANPSCCHFGIVGSIYQINNQNAFSLVDLMKPFSYMYDVIHDRLNKMMARNWGKIIQIDFAKIPKQWDMDKWLYFARKEGIAVIDSFNEGTIGAATGKLAGGLNNAQSGVIDADWGNNIQQYINLLEFIKMEMSDVAGISKQREGQISNRETVGGVERATLQSSHITEKYFLIHEDVKKRATECFLETAKIALKGRNKKFPYILSDGSMTIVNIDGDEFAENDYGLVVDNSNSSQTLNSNLDTLAQAALQNQALSFSTIMKIYGSASIAEKQRMIENDERKMQERQQQAQQQEMQMQQQQLEAQEASHERDLESKQVIADNLNATNLEIARIKAATVFAQADADTENTDGIQEPMSEYERESLKEKIREFNANLTLERDKLKETIRNNNKKQQ